jgi:NADH-quinone oxidoreductase subunit A
MAASELQLRVMFHDYFPLFLLFLVVGGFVTVTMVLTHLLGPKRSTAHKLEAFECGIESKGDARVPFSVSYFLVAILFVLFDVEVVFFYPYAVNFRQLGWEGFGAVALFTAAILVCFFYILGEDILEFGNR